MIALSRQEESAVLTLEEFVELYLNADEYTISCVEKILEEGQQHFELQEWHLGTDCNTE